MDKEFTITFWIRISQNPKWGENDSDINFPPITANNGAKIFFSKYGKYLKVYILHPEFGYKKLTTNIEKYLKRDTFLALTNSPKETKLYINANLVKTVKKSAARSNLEIGDYVMVQIKPGDSKLFTVGENIQIVLPAKIIETGTKSVKLQLFQPSEIIELPKERILY